MTNKQTMQAAAGIFLVIAVFSTGYRSGSARATVKHQEAIQVAQASHISDLEATQAAFNIQLAKESAQAKATILALRNRPDKVVYVKGDTIEKIIKESNCTHLGDEFKRVFRDIHTFAAPDS